MFVCDLWGSSVCIRSQAANTNIMFDLCRVTISVSQFSSPRTQVKGKIQKKRCWQYQQAEQLNFS
jgi:hypothetical protein